MLFTEDQESGHVSKLKIDDIVSMPCHCSKQGEGGFNIWLSRTGLAQEDTGIFLQTLSPKH